MNDTDPDLLPVGVCPVCSSSRRDRAQDLIGWTAAALIVGVGILTAFALAGLCLLGVVYLWWLVT